MHLPGYRLTTGVRRRLATEKPSEAVRSPRHRVLRLESLESRLVLDGGPLISEFLAENNNVLDDEDGNSSDFIEIFNPSGNTVVLDGWYLADDDDPTPWRFPDTTVDPDVTIPPGGYLTVFASGKNRTDPAGELHTDFELEKDGDYLALLDDTGAVVHEYAPQFPQQLEDISYGVFYDVLGQTSLIAKGDSAAYTIATDDTLGSSWIQTAFDDGGWNTGTTGLGFGLGLPDGTVTFVPTGSVWRYLDDGSNQGTAWRNAGFDDLLWDNGPAQLGYGDGDEQTVVGYGPDSGNKYVTTYFRHTFDVQNAWQISDLALRLLRDDGGVVYLNGQEIARSNMPGGAVDYTTRPSGTVGGGDEDAFYDFPVDPAGLLLEGDNVLAVEIHQGSSGSSDISFDLELTGTASVSGLIETDLEAEMLGANASAFVRMPFSVGDPAEYTDLLLRMGYEDGYVAYLNGVEVASRNAPDDPQWNSTADADRPIQDAVQLEEVDLSGYLHLLTDADNVLAIHALNDDASDGTFLVIPELIGLRGVTIEQQYFTTPTPGADNIPGVIGLVADTQFSVDRGFYDLPFDVEITTKTEGAEIRYTIDGSAPTPTYGTVYTGPIHIAQTTGLRAAAFKPGHLPTNVDTQTYIFLDQVLQQPSNPWAVAGYHPPGVNDYWPEYWVDRGGGSVLGNYQVDPDSVNDPRYAGTIKDDLRALPTISIVTDQYNLWDPATGIYANPGRSGLAWERPTSVEMFDGTGETMFQVNAGVRIQGGASRGAGNKKHSFRLKFKSEFGPSKLDYPMFAENVVGAGAVEKFDTISLRAGFNDRFTDTNATLLQDRWAAETQLAMGGAGTHGSFVHLYVNGLYWGLYNSLERPDESFAASYFGGSKNDYDVYSIEGLKEGNSDGWNELWSTVSASPIDYAAVEQILDVPAFIDYLILNQYGGNWDWPQNNWWASYNRADPDGKWRWHSWDAEGCLRDTNGNRVNQYGSRLGAIYQRLAQVDEFKLLFADHVQRHLFNDGVLTTEANIARLDAMAAVIDRAIVGESARWGDGYNDSRNPPVNRDDHWIPRIDWLRNTYFPNRGETVLQQWRNAGLFPEVNVPQLNQHGGQVESGFDLTMSVSVSQVYEDTVVLPEFTQARYLVPTDNHLGTTWTEWGFNDDSWGEGQTGIGYENSPADYAALINTQVRPQDVHPQANTIFVRIPFEIDDLDVVDHLTLRMKYEDGYVAYINGQEAARSPGLNGSPGWDSTAPGHSDGEAKVFQDADVSSSIGRLVESGENMLAIHVLNTSTGSSDLLVLPELVVGTLVEQPEGPHIYYTTDGSDPRLADDNPSPSALLYDGTPVTLTESGWIESRTFFGDQWSALSEARFFVDQQAGAGNLVVSELNYHPIDPTADEITAGFTNDEQFEFIELHNTSDDPLDLSGVVFGGEIGFAFEGSNVTSLAPRGYVLVVSDTAAFEHRYGIGLPVAGQFTGELDDGGQQLLLTDWQGQDIFDFEYDDKGGWPDRADGSGSTLELRVTGGDLADDDNWRSSSEYGGLPGAAGIGPIGGVIVNEVLTHTDLPEVDAVELYNTTDTAIDIGGWWLSDSTGDYFKFAIPPGTMLPAGGYRVFDERDFNASRLNGDPADDDPNDFALNSGKGDDVWLLKGDTAGRAWFVDHVEFGPAACGQSFGRWPNGDGELYPMTGVTLGSVDDDPRFGAPNSGPCVGSVIVSEVMYHPVDPDGAGPIVADDLEFIELYNRSGAAAPLWNSYLVGGTRQDYGWTIEGYELPAGTTIDPGETLLVVPFDPNVESGKADVFRGHYGLDETVDLLGGYGDDLDDGGEAVRLRRAGEPFLDDDGQTYVAPYLLVDEVDYDDEPPWPTAPDGVPPSPGASLNRLGDHLWGRDASGWAAAAPSPGSVAFPIAGADDATTDVSTAVTIDVLANDSGTVAAIDPTSVFISAWPIGGELEIDPGNGRLTYTPDDGFSGEDTFAYRVKDVDGHISNEAPVTVTVNSTAAEAIAFHVFYNNSRWDGFDPGPGIADDAAIATDKTALLPGDQPATFANYTSYSRGINGLMIDVKDLADAGNVGPADFEFRVGNDCNSPTGWNEGPAPAFVDVRQIGADLDRITLIWADDDPWTAAVEPGAIAKQWVQVRVLASERTGLGQDCVFYFGNAIGETANLAGNTAVDATDEIDVREHPAFFPPADIENPYDFDRDKIVGATDQIIARNNRTFADALQLLAPVSVVATDDASATESNVSVQIDVLSNDRDAAGVPSGVDWVGEFSLFGAAVTLNADNTLTYDPGSAAAFQMLAPGQAQEDTFAYEIRDASGRIDVGTVTVTVTGTAAPGNSGLALTGDKTLAHDLVLSQGDERGPDDLEAALGEMAWLYESEQTGSRSRPSTDDDSIAVAVDMLLSQ